jgi:peptidoglycan/xylan/chitin deacetylase (PgdA/CDA1 family)
MSSKLREKIAFNKPHKEKTTAVNIANTKDSAGESTTTLSIKNKHATKIQNATKTHLTTQANKYEIIILFFDIGETSNSSKLLNILAEKNQKAVIE